MHKRLLGNYASFSILACTQRLPEAWTSCALVSKEDCVWRRHVLEGRCSVCSLELEGGRSVCSLEAARSTDNSLIQEHNDDCVSRLELGRIHMTPPLSRFGILYLLGMKG